MNRLLIALGLVAAFAIASPRARKAGWKTATLSGVPQMLATDRFQSIGRNDAFIIISPMK